MKEKYKTLLLAMVIPLIVASYFSYGLHLIISQRQEMWDTMQGQSLGGETDLELKKHYDSETQAILMGGIITIVVWFSILTVICYVVIDWVKKRRKRKTSI